MLRKGFFLLFLLVATSCKEAPTHSVVLRGGMLFDGTGAPGIRGDLAISGDRIVAMGDVPGTGATEIDASGLYVAPGFTDMHSHSEVDRMLNDGRGPSFALQGVTTEVYGETESMGPLGGKRETDLPEALRGKWTSFGEFLDYLEGLGTDINVASYVGSGGIRANVMGYEDRAPTDAELEEMKEMIRQAMREGALGVSAGMSYVPNIYMTTDELASLVRVAAEMGGLFANHARTMNGTDPEAIAEALQVGEKANAAVHFFHLNSTSSTRADEFLSQIEAARARGMSVTGDSYTYTWGITGLADYIPAWAQADGREAMLERLRDPEQRTLIAAGFVTEPPYFANIGWHHIRLGVRDPEINGKLVSEVSEMRGQPPEEVFMDVVLEQEGRGIVIDWNNEEETLRQVMAKPYVTGGTDGSALDLQTEHLPPLVHPRHLGTFPRWLGTYVRDEKLMSWEEAIQKLAAHPAEILGLRERGLLKEGYFADVIAFDPETINGRATFEDPFHYSVGMEHVFVNGVAVVRDGELTGEKPGRAMRGPGYVP
ncbi:MAG TPA: D-aminoacylase [Vicinamibacteria bacterium]|nr:D-aminoacylase [Vicinamibacteria bacterium]